jgi:hypothetical protein
MRAKHVKAWLTDIRHKEKVARDSPGMIADAEGGGLDKK